MGNFFRRAALFTGHHALAGVLVALAVAAGCSSTPEVPLGDGNGNGTGGTGQTGGSSNGTGGNGPEASCFQASNAAISAGSAATS